MLSRRLDYIQKKKLIIFNLGIISLVSITYWINTIYIKPKLNEHEDWLSFFMVNYLNDLGAGIMIAAFSHLLFILTKRRYIISLRFYIFLAFVECIIWEFMRPFVLMIFNPFNKTPKFLWGDMLAYTIGTMIVYLLFLIIYKGMSNESKRTK